MDRDSGASKAAIETEKLSPDCVGSESVGFGELVCNIAICMANRPPIDDYPQLDHLKPLAAGDIAHIVANTSNHWRKVFNVFAKLLYELADSSVARYPSWQSYRDQQLLQLGSSEALLFSPPVINDMREASDATGTIYVIAGKTYAAELNITGLIWLDTYFAIHPRKPIIVSPYLDYRQLSNERIAYLATLVKQVRARHEK